MRLPSLLLSLSLLCGSAFAQMPMAQLLATPIYRMTPQDAHRYIAHMRASEPDLRKRIAAIGRQNIGQPYMLILVG